MYDRRIWKKDAAWENSQWHSSSYRSVDEFEYLYFFWKPGETQISRNRLSKREWVEWGSRAVWEVRSVRRNDVHSAMFPEQLATRVIRLLTDPEETVLDPFLGSGTTALSAIDCGRRFIGVEKESEYFDLAVRRVTDRLQERKSSLPFSDALQ